MNILLILGGLYLYICVWFVLFHFMGYEGESWDAYQDRLHREHKKKQSHNNKDSHAKL